MKFWRGSRRGNYVATSTVGFQFNDVRLQHGPPERFTQLTSLNRLGLNQSGRTIASESETVECNLYDPMPGLSTPST
ncbi:hypothetical protein AB7M17_007805 [Bradyrhizobium sp. USDA 377]